MPTTDAGLELLLGTENANEGESGGCCNAVQSGRGSWLHGPTLLFYSSDRGPFFSSISNFPRNFRRLI